jgi:hypothetical protein
MAFAREAVRTPTAIGNIEVHLLSPDPALSEAGTASFTVHVKYSDGSTRTLSGNLAPHLSNAQINGLLAFMSDMRVKAVNEIL